MNEKKLWTIIGAVCVLVVVLWFAGTKVTCKDNFWDDGQTIKIETPERP